MPDAPSPDDPARAVTCHCGAEPMVESIRSFLDYEIEYQVICPNCPNKAHAETRGEAIQQWNEQMNP